MNNGFVAQLAFVVAFSAAAVDSNGDTWNLRNGFACGDDRDTIIAEYNTYGVGWTPGCNDFSQTAHSDHFAFSELNSGDYSWAVIDAALTIPETSAYGLERWRKEYGGSRIVNSGYRNPKHNSDIGGAKDSRHMYGDAADLRNESRTETEWTNMQAAAMRAKADFIEPRDGPCDIGCVHADWRTTSEPLLRQDELPQNAKSLNLQQMLATADAETRANTFESFVQSIMAGRRKRDYQPIAARLGKEASGSLIQLLTKENMFVHASTIQKTPLPETFTDYYADLIGTVAALHDPASVTALLQSAFTGWIAIRGVAQFGSAALPEAAKVLRQGDVLDRRASALVIRTIVAEHKYSPEEAIQLNSVLKVALDDSDVHTRLAVLQTIGELPPDDFAEKLRSMEQSDTWKVHGKYPIRNLAAQILRKWGKQR